MGHDGGVAAGDYCQTLDFTDIASTWTETMAVRNKAQAHVFEALQKVRKQLPFPLLGLDSDNGSEFINEQLSSIVAKSRSLSLVLAPIARMIIVLLSRRITR